MKTMGLQWVVRGKKVVTTNPDTAQPCPDNTVNRAFRADMPNQLWVSDFTYVSSWQAPRHGLSDLWRSHCSIHVAIRRGNRPRDCFPTLLIHRRHRPEDRRLGRLNLHDDRFFTRALNQAICQRAPSEADKLIRHSDRGSQSLSIRYTERLAEAGIDTPVGSVGRLL